MIPYRLLHFDEDVYGEDVQAFKPERFAGDAADLLTRGSSWRPFGGGKTMCGGRYIAQRAILTFVGITLHRFDISMDKDSKMPIGDLGRPVLGIMAVKKDEDYTVRISPRFLKT